MIESAASPNPPQIPSYAWSRPIGFGWAAPYVVRYASNVDDGPWHGAPLGGFGAGCIGRSPRGDFTLWHIDGGEHVFQSAEHSFGGCQFSLFEQVGDTVQTYALSTEPPLDGTLKSWNWYPASTQEQSTGTYAALYPRSWFTYENVFKAQITCEQFSPIWPDNYQEASYPVAVFEWTLHNLTDQPLTLSLMVSWQNLVNWFTNANKSPDVQQRDDGSPFYDYVPPLGKSEGSFNQWMDEANCVGILMDGARQDSETCQEGEGQWAIAAPKSS
ncbi:MAG: GH116 family glycosyl-hydrolase, partial [Cyanobacteria bacterium P01_H01_bin.119]